MNEKQKDLLVECIKLENNMANLYELFHAYYEEEKDFWMQMSEEETNHASFLNSILQLDFPPYMITQELVATDLRMTKEINVNIEKICIQIQNAPLSRKEALKLAIHYEKSSIELFFQIIADSQPTNEYIDAFKELIGEDKDHAKRIGELIIEG